MNDRKFREAVKAQLVQMTINDELPADMTTLDIDAVFENAEKSLKNSKRLLKLSNYVSYDDDAELEEMLDILENYPNGNENAGHIDGIQMIELYEYEFTVSDLLKEIS